MEHINYVIKNKKDFKTFDGFLRQVIVPWMDASRWRWGARRVITKEATNTVVHHIYPYHRIKAEIFENLRLP